LFRSLIIQVKCGTFGVTDRYLLSWAQRNRTLEKGEAMKKTIGGALIGGAIASGPGYYGPGYGYYGGPAYVAGPGYYDGCYWQRQRFWDGYGWRIRRVRVCGY
jgi:hypothetical protein